MQKLRAYMKKYFIDAMGAMAQGLFASLLIGTIFKTIGQYLGLDFLVELAGICSGASGMAIGAAIAYTMKVHPLVLFSCAAVGSAGYALGADIAVTLADGAESVIHYTAGPAGAFFAVIAAAEVGMLVSRKTKVDILVTPSVTILTGFLAAKLLCPAIAYIMYWLGAFINTATVMHPFIMGIVVSVVVGIILTLPISSAAICAMIGITGIAGGAAVVGCCAQMVGFAAASFRENRWGGVVSQGLGTSMLQMGNICRRPQIWLPPTLAAAVVGPVSTLVFKLECSGVSAGMGTCGLVGPLGILTDMGSGTNMWIGMVLCCVVLPAVLSLVFSEIMRKLGWIRLGDQAL
ncbi:MAG: PTS sugar transporter subunit IIC [Clostridia bacterium]|nr:PTS sugar transporter subunit IIC [Clostridia bacterium]